MKARPWDLGCPSVMDIVDGEDHPGLSYRFAARAKGVWGGGGHEMVHVVWDLGE